MVRENVWRKYLNLHYHLIDSKYKYPNYYEMDNCKFSIDNKRRILFVKGEEAKEFDFVNFMELSDEDFYTVASFIELLCKENEEKVFKLRQIEGNKEKIIENAFKETKEVNSNKVNLKEAENKVNFYYTYQEELILILFMLILPLAPVLFYFIGKLVNEEGKPIEYYVCSGFMITLLGAMALLLVSSISYIILKEIRKLEYKSKLRKLPFTNEELEKNNLNNFNSYVRYLTDNLTILDYKRNLFSLDSIFLTETQKSEVECKLSEMFMKEYKDLLGIDFSSVEVISMNDYSSSRYPSKLQDNVYYRLEKEDPEIGLDGILICITIEP